ncbi:hypothetical protein [Cyanothece sp. BG0011]|uniref:hypothetical protein n=1 Tax=Cyanothece sp. BG0011 TaxID=2082950 RepID=UPI000D1D66DD|nr:hypothetical protein [Cyanothece sp. BG0011]
MTATDIKQELLNKIEKLPDSRLQTVLQFVNELPEFKETSLDDIADENEDPLLGFIGQGNQGSLAQNIDEELYGK